MHMCMRCNVRECSARQEHVRRVRTVNAHVKEHGKEHGIAHARASASSLHSSGIAHALATVDRVVV